MAPEILPVGSQISEVKTGFDGAIVGSDGVTVRSDGVTVCSDGVPSYFSEMSGAGQDIASGLPDVSEP